MHLRKDFRTWKYFSKNETSWQCTAWLHITIECLTCNCSLLFKKNEPWVFTFYHTNAAHFYLWTHISLSQEKKQGTKFPFCQSFIWASAVELKLLSMLRCNHILHIVHDYAGCAYLLKAEHCTKKPFCQHWSTMYPGARHGKPNTKKMKIFFFLKHALKTEYEACIVL